MFKNIQKRILRKIIIMLVEVIIDFLNDYLINLRTGAPLTPMKHEQDNERDNPISQTAVRDKTNDFINKIL